MYFCDGATDIGRVSDTGRFSVLVVLILVECVCVQVVCMLFVCCITAVGSEGVL